MADTVTLEPRGRVALITFNRPDRMNAFTPAMHRRYRELLAVVEADASLGAIVVTGAGRAFCAGADSEAVEEVAGEPGGGLPGAGRSRADEARPGYGSHAAFDRPFVYHFGLRKPVVAAINGAAAGLGFVLACCCDVRFAASGAKLTSAFGPLALPAEYGLAWLLPRLIGGARANELLISSRVILAEEAEQLGLVHRVVAPDELLDAAVAYADELVRRCAPGALAQTKRQLYAGWMQDLGEAFEESVALADAATRTDDFREGVAALRERRDPRWGVSGADGP